MRSDSANMRLGEHEGGYLPFEFDITKAARAGKNTLTVRVDDPLEIFSEIPHGKQSWYGMLSGIWQSVWVESRPATYIRRVKISTNDEEVLVDVSMRGDLAEGLSAEIIAPDGKVAAHVQADAPRFSIRIFYPLTWSPDEPNLYTLKLNLTGFNKLAKSQRDLVFAPSKRVTEKFCSMLVRSICAVLSIRIITLT